MRSLMLSLLLITTLPQAPRPQVSLAPTAALAVATPRPRVDAPTSFKLTGLSALGVTWDFGDGTAPQAGSATITHIYRSPGTFTAKAVAGSQTLSQILTVVEPRRLVATPTRLMAGKAVAFRLEEALGKALVWDFGDGSAPVTVGPAVSHTFAREGAYQVTVKDAGADLPREFRLTVPVGLQGPGAPFSISYLALRWEDGTAECTVTQGEAGLVAYADLKFEGTGQLQAEWVVDGQAQRTVSQQLGFAKLTTLNSGQARVAPMGAPARGAGGRHTLPSTVPGEFQIQLPTQSLGEHRVTLRVLQPRLAFAVPELRYVVKLAGAAQGPVVTSLSPANAKPGEEVELILTGTGFTADMSLNLGRDVAVLGAPQVLSPERAVVKVFVAPTAQPGSCLIQARRPGGSPAGTARLEIVPPGRPGLQVAPRLAGTPTPVPVVPGPGAPAQPMKGTVPGGRIAPGSKVLPVEPARTGPLASQLKVDERGKTPLARLQGPGGIRATAVNLAQVSKTAPRFSRVVASPGGSVRGVVLDARASLRGEHVLSCTEGQKLKLSQITLATPSFSLVGLNTSGEFQSDNLPILRDTTQFTWHEKNPGTSEQFELRIYSAKSAALLKSIQLPGNRSSYDVNPALVQELGKLLSLQNMKNLNLPTGAGGPAAAGSASAALSPGATQVSARPTAQKTGRVTSAGGLKRAGSPKAGSGATLTPSLGGSAPAQMMEVDPSIPSQMRQKADLVWQLVGFRRYPCAQPEEPTGLPQSLDARPGGTPGRRLDPAPGATTKRGLPGERTPEAASRDRLGVSGRVATAAPQHRDLTLAPKAAGLQAAPVLQRTPDAPRIQPTVLAEVSRSDVWPLRMPATPQGVNAQACTISQNDPKVVLEPNKGANDAAGGGFGLGMATAVKPVHRVGLAGTSTVLDENTYTFDEVLLHGTFDLGARVPYRLIPAMVNNPAADALAQANAAIQGAFSGASGPFGMGGSSGKANTGTVPLTSTVNRVSFKNVFVDWGDGTLEPFAGKPLDTLYANSTDFGSVYRVDAGAYRHTYSRSSTYRVKVFVLSDEDMARQGIVDEVAQALTPSQSAQGVFLRLSSARTATARAVPAGTNPGSRVLGTSARPRGAMAAASVGRASGAGLAAQPGAFLNLPPGAAQALDHAYMVFCKDLIIKDREDPCANLPVHLVATQLDFPTDDSATSKRGRLPALPPREVATSLKAPGTLTRPLPGGSPAPSTASRPKVSIASGSQGLTATATATPGLLNLGPVPSTTPCNLFYSAVTKVSYYGQGTVRVIWKVDGRQVGSREVSVKSPKRVGLKPEEARTCTNPLLGELVLNSPALPVDALGRHQARVDAFVVPDRSGDLNLDELNGLAELAAGRALPTTISPRLAHAVAELGGRGGADRPKVRLGLLNPRQTPGQPAYVSLTFGVAGSPSAGMTRQTGGPGALVGQIDLPPPQHVQTQGTYEVKAGVSDQVCNLFFPTKGGTFPVTNLGSTLSLQAEGALQRASGKGLLVFGLRAGTAPDTVAPFPLDITFSNWKVDGVTVVTGQIDLQPNRPYDGPGVTGKLVKVRGSLAEQAPPNDLLATLELSPTDTSMVLTEDGSRRPVLKAEAPVTTQGDWIAHGLKLERTVLGPTPWAFSAEGVTVDLSSLEGTDPKGGQSPTWVGVRLGQVTVLPATLGIQGGEWTQPLPHPADWTLEGLGLNGKVEVGPWHASYKAGHLTIGKILFSGKGGHYAATYKDVVIQSPWFKDPIQGDASWVRMESGTYMLNLDKLHVAQLPALAGGPLTLEPKDLQFTRIKEGGLLMQGRAHLILKAEGKPLATFDVDRVGFGLDGLLYFGDDGARSTTATLNRAGTLGFTPADLQDAILSGGNAAATPLSLRVNAKLRLSENPILPAPAVTLDYSLKASGTAGVFMAPDVLVSPFQLEVAFPMGAPSMKAKIDTSYQPGATAGAAPAMPSNRFSGIVDLSMFGGAPVKAAFVLGYDQGKDYFATRVDVPVGPSGTPIIPEIIHLYRLSGGFAYNFGPDVFKDGGSVANAKPDFKGETLFMAGARVGSGDGFIYTLDGQLVVRSSGVARMEFGAWLLAHNPSGNPPLHGSLQYGGGNFDGRIWGGFSFLGDTVALDLGATEASAAGSLHFGGGSWRIYAGDRNGQRITGKLMGNTANAYLMLGNQVGLAVGGGSSWYMGAGVGVKAYAKGYMDMGLQITPQPRITGDFGAGLEAGVCAFGECVSGGVSANIHAEALPVSLSASCCLDLPWPLGDICFTVKM